MNWIAVLTTPTKETQVERGFALQGRATFVPMAVRDIAISRHTKVRKLVYSVLIPRVVFVLAPDSIYLGDVEHARQLQKTPMGSVFSIPDSQMSKFRETHSAWLENETKLYRAYIRGLQNKGKKPKKIEASVLGWVGAMQELGEALFGEERQIHPFQQMEAA
jgi:hypothetical protein